MAENTPFYLLGTGAMGTVSNPTPTVSNTATNTATEEEGSGGFNWDGLNGTLAGVGGLLGGVGGLIGGIKGSNAPAPNAASSGSSSSGGNNTPPPATNTTTWILGGVLGLILVGGLIFLIVKK